MGAAIKVLAVLGRFVQFISGVICAGILGRYVYLLDVADLSVNSKLEYALAISGIAITFSLLLIAPFAYQFWAFPFDFAMFVMWMVSFGLLDDLSHGCSSRWYRTNWHRTWASHACIRWRSVEAWMFIGAMAWLANSCLGMYYVFTRTARKKEYGPLPCESKEQDVDVQGMENRRGEQLSRGSNDPISQPQTTQNQPVAPAV